MTARRVLRNEPGFSDPNRRLGRLRYAKSEFTHHAPRLASKLRNVLSRQTEYVLAFGDRMQRVGRISAMAVWMLAACAIAARAQQPAPAANPAPEAPAAPA